VLVARTAWVMVFPENEEMYKKALVWSLAWTLTFGYAGV
jgi:hypothetical protein